MVSVREGTIKKHSKSAIQHERLGDGDERGRKTIVTLRYEYEEREDSPEKRERERRKEKVYEREGKMKKIQQMRLKVRH